MGKAAATNSRLAKRRAVRTGRPPRALAGEVETRILEAARQVFLDRGLAGASMDEIAGLACAGKPTIYARFPNKEALFTAVVMQSVAATIARFEAHAPIGRTVEERLESLAGAILQWILVSDAIDLLRVAIAESRRFPDLASSVHRMARERGAEAVGRQLAEAAQSGELARLPAFTPRGLTTTTRLFQDLVLFPLLLRALFGEKLKQLRAEIAPHVARSVAFFLAACRHGGVDQGPRRIARRSAGG
jgi:AcrR family transcriptional regulator